jgi:hypothetical protein
MRDVTATMSSRLPTKSSIKPSDNDPDERGTAENSQSSGQVRLCRRILMATVVVPPVPTGVAFVVRGLLSQLTSDEVVLAAERWPENPFEQEFDANGHRIHFIGAKWTWFKRGQRYLQWMRWLLVPRMAYRLVKLARSKGCDAIFVHFPDEQFLCAAYLAARSLGLSFFPFFHNTYRENRSGIGYHIATRLQRRVFRSAKVIFVMSEGMQKEWQSMYPGHRFEPLVHTTDEKIPSFAKLPPIDRSCVKLGYLGSIGEANLDALHRVCDVVNSSPNLELNIYSGAPGWFLQKENLVGPRIHHHQPTDDVLLDTLRENDILMLPHGLVGGLAPIEYRTIFPTRTIPYLLSGRPIIAHSAPDSFLTRWLSSHDCADLVVEPDPVALRAAIDQLCRDASRQEQLVRNALIAAEQFRAQRVVDKMKLTINQFLDEGHTAGIQ